MITAFTGEQRFCLDSESGSCNLSAFFLNIYFQLLFSPKKAVMKMHFYVY